jgi:hypothetical protein
MNEKFCFMTVAFPLASIFSMCQPACPVDFGLASPCDPVSQFLEISIYLSPTGFVSLLNLD